LLSAFDSLTYEQFDSGSFLFCSLYIQWGNIYLWPVFRWRWQL